MTKLEILRNYYGHSSFRQGQEKLIDAVLGGRDVLGIMPTGGGKSVCYQIPAMMLPGVSLVISPLVSLMNDQVAALKAMGINGAFINSSLTFPQLRKVYMNLASGMYKIIYVAPERLDSEGFLAALSGLEISMIAVDEAHCVSQWGNDFRPSYLRIKDFVSGFSRRPTVAAFTATATGEVRKDIISLLGLDSPVTEITGYDRPNLYFAVERPSNRPRRLLELIEERKDRCGIVYCSTRKSVESVCDILRDRGFSAVRYHAGLEQEERQANQDDFQYDRAKVMVATNAFGMGIDKSNVSYVIHYNMPKSIEAYYQEAGRAGRDGEPADCILLYSRQDIMTAKFLIENNGNEEHTPEERARIKRLDLKRLDAMTDYCETGNCLRGKLLDYFSQSHPQRCDNCSCCNAGFTHTDVTREAQMILSCIIRINRKLGYHMGLSTAVNVLTGSSEKRLLEKQLDTLPTYGIAKDIPSSRFYDTARSLIRMGYISEEEHSTLDVTPKANPVLKGEERVYVYLRPEVTKKPKPAAAVYARPGAEADSALLEKLREVRLKLSLKEHVPAYVIFNNATLTDMALREPQTEEEFLEVSGVGKTKAKKYGEIFMQAIKDYRSK